jgi:hypothetical protein
MRVSLAKRLLGGKFDSETDALVALRLRAGLFLGLAVASFACEAIVVTLAGILVWTPDLILGRAAMFLLVAVSPGSLFIVASRIAAIGMIAAAAVMAWAFASAGYWVLEHARHQTSVTIGSAFFMAGWVGAGAMGYASLRTTTLLQRSRASERSISHVFD